MKRVSRSSEDFWDRSHATEEDSEAALSAIGLPDFFARRTPKGHDRASSEQNSSEANGRGQLAAATRFVYAAHPLREMFTATILRFDSIDSTNLEAIRQAK